MNNKVIKFRLWNKNAKDFVGGCDNAIGHFDLIRLSIYLRSAGIFCLDDYVVQQFTDFFDKNKTPIYEGDIITFSVNHHNGRGVIEYLAKVMWLNGGFTAIFKNEMTLDNGFKRDRINLGSDMLVIGNILQNPELLK